MTDPAALAATDGRTTRAIAEAIARGKEAILTAWASRVKADPSVPHADELTELELRDHVPTLLDDLVVRLAEHAEAAVSGERSGRSAGTGAAARAHAVQRLRDNYDVPAVIRELSHLRIVVMQHLERQSVGLGGEAAVLVHTALDEGIRTATTEIERRRTEVLAREANLRETMLGVLGHDLRQPLHTVSVAAELLASSVAVGDPSLRLVRHVQRGTARMTSMVGDLLDFTRANRVGGNGIPLSLQPESLRSVLANIAEELQLAHPSRAFRLDVGEELPGLWDTARLAQAFGNLLGNAFTYGAPDTPITMEAHATTGDSVSVTITNQGAPIPSELLPSLFEPFRRGPVGTRPKGASEGLGLGLYIAHAIVTAHGGTIAVESSAGEGTRFIVSLPTGTHAA